ncbi:uncharacterized protein EI97DRAFT_455639 [Westerdykella ornata]|uniref:Uncharacterized protein n=1 Tax=Westerdykella ornata TaxID=318751 RepID=A0A6A6JUG1_WESOR|nr:uncharacterized protein EI97DRAFT_455639 [Westerdykella ornata]KAF2279386.1 hypothetical protein EI97DRAFT_455639 [Westerdykella ornata]
MPRRKSNNPAVSHRRGATHGVKDEHRTHTKWDHFGRTALEEELRSRPGLYRKDLRKHEIARLLADDDKAKRKAAMQRMKEKKKQFVARQKQEKEEQKKKKRETKVRAGKGVQRETQKEAGVEISHNSSEEEQVGGAEKFGDVLEDETTESETHTPVSVASPVFTNSRLRLFEWPDQDLPPSDAPQSLYGVQGEQEIQPYSIPYAVMALVTTLTEETIQLPGSTYPDGIGAEFVPKLTQYVMNAARNGVLVGTLRKAVIESGESWTERTQVQWWNGRMYFRLPPRTSTAPLPSIRGRKLKSTKVKTGRTPQTQRDKRLEMLQNYASSEYRPPIGFSPVFLEYPDPHDDDVNGPRTLGNLFYIRFPGMDLPHYYFWTRPNEWRDPTTPNPAWLPAKTLDDAMEHGDSLERDRVLHEDDTKQLCDRRASHADRLRPYGLELNQIRVKKEGMQRKFHCSPRRLSPMSSKFDAAVRDMERQLYEDGLAAVLQRCREQALEDGKHQHWYVLIDNMVRLYPSGELPKTPPVHLDQVPRSLAEKIASIYVPNPSRPASPIQGDEPWTRNDDEYWDVVEVPKGSPSGSGLFETDIQQELLRAADSDTELRGDSTNRRRFSHRSSTTSILGAKRLTELDAWVQSLQPASEEPKRESTAMNSTPLDKAVRAAEREWWEGVFEQAQADAAGASRSQHRSLRSHSIVTGDNFLTKYAIPGQDAQAHSLSVAGLKWQLHTLMNQHLKHETQCRVCFEPLEQGDVEAVRRHYQRHYDEADAKCPFCDMEWGMLDSEWKASHIFTHDFDDSVHQRRRSSIPVALYSIPRRRSLKGKVHEVRIPASSSSPQRKQTESIPPERRRSKVHFSPRVVEKRIPYNDNKLEEGEDADVSGVVAPNPRKSSLKRAGMGRRSSVLDSGKGTERVTKTKKKKAVRTNKAVRTRTSAQRRTSLELDPTVISPTSASDHISSPELHLMRRRPKNHPEAAWDPRRHSDSGSSHVPSPYLPPSMKRYDKDHPDAAFDPRRWSTSGTEGLEPIVRKKGKKKKASEGNKAQGKGMTKPKAATRAKQSSATATKGKGKAKVDKKAATERGPDPFAIDTYLHRKVSDSEEPYLPSPSASSTTTISSLAPSLSSVTARKGKGKARPKSKAIDPTYRDAPPSPTTSSERSPILRARRRNPDPAWQYASASETPSPVVRKQRKNKSGVSEKRKKRVTAPDLSSSIKDDFEPQPVDPQQEASVEGKRSILPLKIPFLSRLTRRLFGASGEMDSSSTASNTSPNRVEHIEDALQTPDVDVIDPPPGVARLAPSLSTKEDQRRGRKSAPGTPTSSASKSSKKRKASTALLDDAPPTPISEAKKRKKPMPKNALHRRSSILPLDVESNSGDDDAAEDGVNGGKALDSQNNYLAFSDGYLAHDSDDQLTGNPFASTPKREVKSSVKKKNTPSKTRNTIHAPDPDTPTQRQVMKSTLSGRPFVEPLIIAPAQRLGLGARRARRGVHPPAAELQTPTPTPTPTSGASATTRVPVTSTDRALSSASQQSPSSPRTGRRIPRTIRSNGAAVALPKDDEEQQALPRWRRSAAPSPSSSLYLHTSKSRGRQSQIQRHPQLQPPLQNPLPSPSPTIAASSTQPTRRITRIQTKAQTGPGTHATPVKRPSFDVPYSDPAPIAPPNTPALGMGALGQLWRKNNSTIVRASVGLSRGAGALVGGSNAGTMGRVRKSSKEPNRPEALPLTPLPDQGGVLEAVISSMLKAPVEAPVGLGITLVPSPLDAGALTEKIGRVKKTTRGGAVVSSLPAAVGARGAAVDVSSRKQENRRPDGRGKGRGSNEKIDKVITGRVEKKTGNLTQSKARGNTGGNTGTRAVAKANCDEAVSQLKRGGAETKVKGVARTAKFTECDGNNRRKVISSVVTRSMAKRR